MFSGKLLQNLEAIEVFFLVAWSTKFGSECAVTLNTALQYTTHRSVPPTRDLLRRLGSHSVARRYAFFQLVAVFYWTVFCPSSSDDWLHEIFSSYYGRFNNRETQNTRTTGYILFWGPLLLPLIRANPTYIPPLYFDSDFKSYLFATKSIFALRERKWNWRGKGSSQGTTLVIKRFPSFSRPRTDVAWVSYFTTVITVDLLLQPSYY